MSINKDNKTGRKADIPNLSELFGEAAKLDVTERDVFGGELSLVRREAQRADAAAPAPSVGHGGGAPSLTNIHFILIANLIILSGILLYMVLRPTGFAPAPAAAIADTTAPTPPPAAALPIQDDPTDPATFLRTMELGRHAEQALDGAVSLQTAEAFYAAHEYRKAAHVYERLRRNLTVHTLQDEALADWLTLQMALCLQRSQEQALMPELFVRAMNSRSPGVRALTHYNLAFIQNHNRSFLEARRQAYQALALLKTIEVHLPMTVEADCYFLAAESLTRHLLRINNITDDLPGTLWSHTQPTHSLSAFEQTQLGAMLTEGVETLNQAVMSPRINVDRQRPVGSQWSAYAVDGPLDLLLQQYAAAAQINLNLSSLSATARRHTANLFLPQVDRNYLAEVAAGSAGMVWRFDGQTGYVFDPADFEDTHSLRAAMVQEAIAIWQRFLLRYRGDHRTPNVHYCLGRLYTLAEEDAAALGEYKLLASQFPNNPLAPYALLDSSRIKTNLRDYTGAQVDLNELLIRYPNSRIMDEALLYLAEATMDNGSYAEAAEMFQRAYHLNVGQEARRRAAFGLGRCAFEQGRYDEAARWLTQTLTLITDRNDSRLAQTCYMLGNAYIQTGRFVEAADVLRTALGGRLANREYVQIILELVNAETMQNRHLHALNILESVPETHLNQEESVELMLARARVYRQIDIPSTAISQLRRKIQFIAESRLRARISLELAECYLQNGETAPARQELNEAIHYLPAGRDSQRAAFLLAYIAYLNKNIEQARALCMDALRLDIQDETLRRQVYDLLGTIYREQQAYEKAALAYAGLLEKAGVE